jgi:hypothetical protein
MSRLKRMMSRKKEEFSLLKQNAQVYEKRSQSLEYQLRTVRSLLSVETGKRTQAEKELRDMRVRFWELLASRQTSPWGPVRHPRHPFPTHKPLNTLLPRPTTPPPPTHPFTCEPPPRDYTLPSYDSTPSTPIITPFPDLPDDASKHQEDIQETEEVLAKLCNCGETHAVHSLALKYLKSAQQSKTAQAAEAPKHKADKSKERKSSASSGNKTPKTTKKVLRTSTSSESKKTVESVSSAAPASPTRPRKKLRTPPPDEMAKVHEKQRDSAKASAAERMYSSSAMTFRRFLMPAMAAIVETFGGKTKATIIGSSGSLPKKAEKTSKGKVMLAF